MGIKAKIKIWLWKLSLLKQEVCPVCGDDMRMHYTSNFPGEYWLCNTYDCEFNGEEEEE